MRDVYKRQGLDSAFKRAVKRVNAPGFRKGKLPRAVLDVYKRQVYNR